MPCICADRYITTVCDTVFDDDGVAIECTLVEKYTNGLYFLDGEPYTPVGTIMPLNLSQSEPCLCDPEGTPDPMPMPPLPEFDVIDLVYQATPETPKAERAIETARRTVGSWFTAMLPPQDHAGVVGYDRVRIRCTLGDGGPTGAADTDVWRDDFNDGALEGYIQFNSSAFHEFSEYHQARIAMHEIVHALGIGPAFDLFGYEVMQGGGKCYIGPVGVAEYQALAGGFPAATCVPLSPTTIGHWAQTGEGHPSGQEDCLNAELMSLSGAQGMAASRVTLGALVDLGYPVDVNRADPFSCGDP